MKVRTITGAVITALFAVPCIFSEYIVYPIVIALLCVMAVFEMLRVLGLEKSIGVSLPSYLLAAALPLGTYFAVGTFGGMKSYFSLLALAMAFYLLYLLFFAVIRRAKLPFSRVSGAFTAIAYILASFTALAGLRYIENGVYVFVIVFISSCVCDVFAYFTGYLFGKHKLIPEISPKKTVEGAVGGTVFALLALLLYGFILSKAGAAGVSVNYPILAVYGLVLAIVGQFGDLIASLIKREFGVKDYGRLFPGHGGVLDRFDSMMPISLVLMFLSFALPSVF
ncbi:MAG: phosphatidate cytidylyltransferase [Clostridia bacterium]|nr:phosphatidate cytidylyltransferase [Clostridia bacterium]